MKNNKRNSEHRMKLEIWDVIACERIYIYSTDAKKLYICDEKNIRNVDV